MSWLASEFVHRPKTTTQTVHFGQGCLTSLVDFSITYLRLGLAHQLLVWKWGGSPVPEVCENGMGARGQNLVVREIQK